MKQKHGKFKLFQKRYFVLFDDELRYYKTQNDIVALAIISLDHYTLVLNIPSEYIQKQNKHLFALLSDDTSKYDWPDYFLQAESEQEWQMWVDCLEALMHHRSTSVLDKWLERLDVPHQSFYGNEFNSSVPTLSRRDDDYDDDERSSISSSILLTPEHNTNRFMIRNHKSAESLSILKASNEAYKRRPSDFSNTIKANKRPLFPYRLFSWTTTHHDQPTTPKSTPSIISMPSQDDSTTTTTTHEPIKAFESPIIHPSEYNQDP
ncbi:hypothetical protein G6F64_007924 [Rhizopus arrhizus]|uniref:PH domain-containing protein n=1 Tax=Rhizopus oryzae TaxID=64495 RepID=A0A9P6X5Y2_RHIOR|nr:hypothetical protein G6F64_007924 [Rhizopus arrhizus]